MKRPPIEGMPTERPRCANCGKLISPRVHNTYAPWSNDAPSRLTARRFAGWNWYNELFHSLNCALIFATLAHRAGYRRTVK